MKRCPSCNRVESDDTLKFCRLDGAVLVADESAPTLILPEATNKPADIDGDQIFIGVLPFVNLSTDAENEFFCDGLAEELINALTRIEKLHVLARTSSFSFKGGSWTYARLAGNWDLAMRWKEASGKQETRFALLPN